MRVPFAAAFRGAAGLALAAVVAATPARSDPASDAWRGPYLQSLGRDSVLVVWGVRDEAPAAVDFGPTRALGRSARATSVGSRHVAVLRALDPGTTYYYQVRAGDRVLAGGPGHCFRTDAGRGDRAFSFFVTADIGDPGGEQESTARSILRASPRPELGLLAGDIVYKKGSSASYDRNLMRPWSELLRAIPVWPVLGNHDWKSDPETNFRSEWYLPHNEHWYSFDYANAHFVALDTRDGDIYEVETQTRWLEADLSAHHGAEWVFVYFHHPGITCTYKGNTRAVVEHFLPVLDRHGVDVVFNGHAHTYERLYPIRNGRPVDAHQDPHYTDPRGTIYIVSGAGAKVKEGRATRKCGPTAFFRDRTVLWTHVEVDGSRCTIRSRASADDALVDEVTITKTGVAPGAQRPE